jgi:hypothetical protein
MCGKKGWTILALPMISHAVPTSNSCVESQKGRMQDPARRLTKCCSNVCLLSIPHDNKRASRAAPHIFAAGR